MDFGFAAIPAIVVICYAMAMLVKATPLDNKWLPVICAVTGAVMGALALNLIPDYPASDYITAVAIGIVSGLAATGTHQIFKQLGG